MEVKRALGDRIALLKRLWIALEKAWYIHRYWLAVSIVLFSFSFYFIFSGYNTLPPIHDQNVINAINVLDANMTATLNASITNMTSTPVTETGETTFTLPARAMSTFREKSLMGPFH